MPNRLEQATKLSELLLTAIEDFEKQCEVPNFNPSMGDWVQFYPPQEDDEQEQCFGCLAGACLIQEYSDYEKFLVTEFDGSRRLEFFELPPGISNKLHAINYLRAGDIADAHVELFSEDGEWRDWHNYESFGVVKFRSNDEGDNRDRFLTSMRELHAHLLTLGL